MELDDLLDGIMCTISQLRYDNTKLKKDILTHETRITTLETQVDDLVPGIALLRKEHAAMKSAISALMRDGGQWQPVATLPVKRTFTDLPGELTFRIFRETLPPHYQHDPSITQGANNPWLRELRLKKALPLVCKSSYWSGMEVLYEDIVIRRMGQISALAQTLRSPDLGEKLASLIKTIRIDSCPVWLPCADVVREDLSFILSQCAVLSDFSYHPHENFPIVGSFEEHDEQYHGWFNPTWLYQQTFSPEVDPLLARCIASSIRRLDISVPLDCATVRCLHHMLSSAERLEYLKLGRPKECSVCYTLTSLPPLRLPHLRQLQLHYGHETDIDTHIRSCWQMPALSRLTVMLREWAAFDSLIKTVGHSLTYLHLYPMAEALKKCRWDSITSLGVVCPRIEHLVVPVNMLATWPNGLPITLLQLTLHSPTLRYLDLWCDIHDKMFPQPVLGQSNTLRERIMHSQSQVPSLRAVRLLATSRVPGPQWKHSTRTTARNPDWPAICDPALIEEDSNKVLYYRLPRAVVAQTAFALLSRDRSVRGQVLDDEEWPYAYTGDGMTPMLWRPMSDTDSEGGDGVDEGDEVHEGDNGPKGSGELGAAMDGGQDNDQSTDDEDLSDELGHEDLQVQVQLTRDDVLTSFSSSRDTEAYRHVAAWEA